MTTSREWHLTRRPHGVPVDDDFALVDVELHAPGDGEIVVRNSFLSVDPYMRGRMNDAKSYVPPFQLGQPMDGEAVGVVEQVADGAVDSNGSAIAVGDMMIHPLGWRTVSLLHGKQARVLNTSLAPAQTYLGVLGMPGLTAYAGLLRIGALAEGRRGGLPAPAAAGGGRRGEHPRLGGAASGAARPRPTPTLRPLPGPARRRDDPPSARRASRPAFLRERGQGQRATDHRAKGPDPAEHPCPV